MSRFWSPVVHELKPYVAGEQPRIRDIVKLNTNENPYGPSPQVLETIRSAADDGLRLYPDPDATDLRSAIGTELGVREDEVFVGNGSDEVLALIFQAFFTGRTDPLLFPDITYSFYPVYCGLYGIPFTEIPLTTDFCVDVEGYRVPNGGIILANPNAPTGVALSLERLVALVDAHPDSVVVVDEAYIDFGGDSAVALLYSFPNLLVVQTLSKGRSLAGLRVGFAVGHRDLITGLDRVKNCFNSYPLDRLAIAGACAALADQSYFDTTRARICRTRDRMTSGLIDLGFTVLPSAANFVFAAHPTMMAADISAALRQRGIIVRHFARPRIDNFLRITVGTDEQTDRLRIALTEILRR